MENKKVYILWWEWLIWMHLQDYFWTQDWYDVISVWIAQSVFPSKFPNRKSTFLSKDIYSDEIVFEPNSIIVHVARQKAENIEEFAENERKLFLSIVDSNPENVIVFSSSVVYTEWESDYKKEKLLFEDIWSECINATIVRFFNTYWEYQIPYRQATLVANIIYDGIIGGTSKIFNPDQRRNFVYAGDIWKMLEYILENNLTWILDLWWPKDCSFKELSEETKKVNPDQNIDFFPKDDPIFDKNPYDVFPVEFTSFEFGLKWMYDYMKQHIDIYKKLVK